MGFENIIEGDGIGLAVTGMAIVFLGLTFISLYIRSLPRLAHSVYRWREKKTAPARTTETGPLDDPAVLAAIGVVIAAELADERALDEQRITIERNEAEGAWAFAGKMRTLSTRM